ncbi:MAG: type II secretion system F family protein [Candidatus Nomurabacteria bacterium]|nr:type II secretion system F family protein [Candidatus Nomurabacteria bacterium]
MLFTYKAKSKNGEIFEGVMESADRFSLSHELKSKGSIPIHITEKKDNSFDFSDILGRIFSRIKTEELIIFTKNLSGMLRAGLSLSRALSVLKKQTKNVVFDKILTSLSDEIDAGGTLSTGFAKFPNVFSKLFVSMTRAGEESGDLAGTLSEVGANLEKAHSLNKKIKGALIYPGVILSAMVLIGVLMFAFVVPTLANTFKELGVELPASTRFIIALGNFFSQYLILSFVLIIGSVVAIVSLLRASFMKRYVDYVVIRLPVVGKLSKELNTARTTRTMSSLLLSGVSITRAIEITGDVVQNIYYKRVLEDAKKEIEKGAPFSKAFEENPKLYPVMMTEMVQVGEETGKLSDMLSQVASFYEGEIENKTKNLSIIIEPVLMIVIGAAVGFFAISMISPLYSILNNIN